MLLLLVRNAAAVRVRVERVDCYPTVEIQTKNEFLLYYFLYTHGLNVLNMVTRNGGNLIPMRRACKR